MDCFRCKQLHPASLTRCICCLLSVARKSATRTIVAARRGNARLCGCKVVTRRGWHKGSTIAKVSEAVDEDGRVNLLTHRELGVCLSMRMKKRGEKERKREKREKREREKERKERKREGGKQEHTHAFVFWCEIGSSLTPPTTTTHTPPLSLSLSICLLANTARKPLVERTETEEGETDASKRRSARALTARASSMSLNGEVCCFDALLLWRLPAMRTNEQQHREQDGNELL